MFWFGHCCPLTHRTAENRSASRDERERGPTRTLTAQSVIQAKFYIVLKSSIPELLLDFVHFWKQCFGSKCSQTETEMKQCLKFIQRLFSN